MKNRPIRAPRPSRRFADTLIAFSVALLLLSLIFSPAQASNSEKPAARTKSALRAQSPSQPDTSRILSDIKYLASDALEGRGTGRKGGYLAADFLADRFKRMGLTPAGDRKGYFQFLDVTVDMHLGTGSYLKVALAHGESTYVAQKDFIPFGFSSVGTVSGPVTFAGYGISSENYGYDDYSKENPRGKIALVMRGEPQERDEKSVFAGTQLTHYSELRYKATNAREHGASAILVTADPLNHPGEEDELLPFQSLEGPGDCGIPAMQVKEKVAMTILRAANCSLESLQHNIDSLLVPASVDVPAANVSLRVDLVKDTKKVANVIGIIEPSRRSVSEYVVVGAHYDHLGKSSRFSLDQIEGIHNGADDNASGVAAMLDLGRMFEARKDSLKRGIILVGFVGEELGALGSSFYVNSPVVPLDKTVFMLNLDMVGRMRDRKLYAMGTGSSPVLKELLAKANKDVALQVESTESGFGGSDQFSFYAHNVPVLFFFTGPHEDYHKVTDDWDKINVDGIASVVRLSAQVLSDIVFSEAPIPFTRATPDTAAPPGGEGYGTGRGAYFGIVPDFGGEPDKGAKISGVSEGSPAEKAGLKAGDVIVQFAGKTITGLYDLSFALKEEKPGNEVEVVFVRGNDRITVKAVLGKRRAN